MTGKGGSITLDPDKYLKLLDELQNLEKQLRTLGSEGFSGKTTKPANKTKENDQPAMVLDLDISGIQWQTRDKQPAGPDAPWCWAFSETKDGGVLRESMQLVQALEQYGTVKVGRYVISMGGRDKTLLNRKVAK